MSGTHPSSTSDPPREVDRKTFYDRHTVFCLHDLNRLGEPESPDDSDAAVAAGLSPSSTLSASARLSQSSPRSQSSLAAQPAHSADDPPVASPSISITPSSPPSTTSGLSTNWRQYNESVQGSMGDRSTAGGAGGTGANSSGPPRRVSILDLFKEDPHPMARRGPVNTTTLQHDSSIRPGLDVFSGLSQHPERLTRPSFMEEVPEGMNDVWELLRTLFDDVDRSFCNAVLASKSFTTLVSHTLTRLVISKAARNRKFKRLYTHASQSEAAQYLIDKIYPNLPEHFGEDSGYPPPSAASTSNQIDNWDFELSTIRFNPFIKIFRNEVLTYVQSKMFHFISGLKYDAAWIVTQFPTLGKTVPPGEAEGHFHIYPPLRRSTAALAIINHIYGGRSSRDGIRLLMVSPSTYHMACAIVGWLGQSNIGRAQVALGLPISEVKVPNSIIPLAAAFIEQELRIVGECEDEVDGRSGPFDTLLEFSESDRTLFRTLKESWMVIHVRNPAKDPEIIRMLAELRRELNIAAATNRYKAAQAKQLQPVVQQPLILLPSMVLNPPPPYNAEGI